MAEVRPAFTNQPEHVEWIRTFALETYGTDVTEVLPLFIPGFKGGGGGLYMKSNELGFEVKLRGAKDALGPSRESDADGVEKGKVVFVRELRPPGNKPEEALRVCWILRHEFGHAVGDRQEPKNVSEPYAYRFEYSAILKAYEDGQFEKWGFTREMILEFLVERLKTTGESGESTALLEALQQEVLSNVVDGTG